jgi:hypothetical protein
MRAAVLARFALFGTAVALAQTPDGAARQAQLKARFEASGLAVGKAFPMVDVYDPSGKPVNTASLKGFHTVVVSGCLT